MYNATVGTLSAILEDHGAVNINKNADSENIYKVQCFPLYSILLALGKTDFDYFSLDVEGSEYKILRTVPWRKVNITVFM